MMQLVLTRSQQMAMIDILVAYAKLQDEPQEFVDVSAGVTTTTGDLLSLVAPVYTIPQVSTQMLIDAGINGFALQLLSESLAGKKDIHTFKPIAFEYRGVIYMLAPVKQA